MAFIVFYICCICEIPCQWTTKLLLQKQVYGSVFWTNPLVCARAEDYAVNKSFEPVLMSVVSHVLKIDLDDRLAWGGWWLQQEQQQRDGAEGFQGVVYFCVWAFQAYSCPSGTSNTISQSSSVTTVSAGKMPSYS